MIETFVSIAVSLIGLGVLIFVHELGHFLLAKYNGVGVLEFSIGFGKKIWQKRIGDTRYSLGVLPLGGYVRMVGDDFREYAEDADSSEGEEPNSDDGRPEMIGGYLLQDIDECDSERVMALLNDKSRWFLGKGFWAKFSIVFAGPGFNIAFAWFLAVLLFVVYGTSQPLNDAVIGETMKDSPAQIAGLKEGDVVKAIDGEPIDSFAALAKVVRGSNGREMLFSVERNDDGKATDVTLSITGKATEPVDEMLSNSAGGGEPRYVIGVMPSSQRIPVSFYDSLKYGSLHIWRVTQVVLQGFKLIVTGKVSAKYISGPISIVHVASEQAHHGIERFLSFMIAISMSLAVLNLFPIPVLDGGHIFFFVLEALKGSPLSIRAQSIANQVGFVILLGLMLFAIGNDIYQIGVGGHP